MAGQVAKFINLINLLENDSDNVIIENRFTSKCCRSGGDLKSSLEKTIGTMQVQ